MNRHDIAWALAYIYVVLFALSIVPITMGWVALIVGFLSSPLFFIIVYLINSIINLGIRKSLAFLAMACSISFIFEYLGVNYGVPFGHYRYTIAMGPEILGVPIYIPFLWAALGYFTMEAAGNYYLAAIGMVALDAAFDPLLSGPVGLWRWMEKGQYFGVPSTNFLGWFIVSIAFYLPFKLLTNYKPTINNKALIFYTTYYASWILADLTTKLTQVGIAATAILITYLTTLIITQRLKGKTRN